MSDRLTYEMLSRGKPIRAGEAICRVKSPGLVEVDAGAHLSPDRKLVLATANGMAYVHGERVGVFASQLHEGDLTAAESGAFPGNLVVLGSVRPGVRVQVEGSVGVRGAVHYAELEARGSVVVTQECQSSRIAAGPDHRVFQRSLRRVADLRVSLSDLLSVLDQLEHHPAFKTFDLRTNLRPLLELLLERSFSDLPWKIAAAYREVGLHRRLGGTVQHLAERLMGQFVSSRIFSVSRANVEDLLQLVREAEKQLEDCCGRTETVVVGFGAETSHLRSTGTVAVLKGACHSCSIEAGVGVKVGGTLHGGMVVAGESITADFVAGKAALEVGAKGRIEAGCLQTGIITQVGDTVVRIARGYAPAVVYSDGSHLRIESGEEVSFL